MTDLKNFRFHSLDASCYEEGLGAVKGDCRTMLVRVLETILDRYERNADYRFIDTKLSLITGRDFDEDDPIRGKSTIYPWIQGRGLESLAGHMDWLRADALVDREKAARLVERSRQALEEVFGQMEALRENNGGRLYFMMTPQGQALRVDGEGRVVPHDLRADAPSSFSDLFYVKGMVAAASELGLEEKRLESIQWFKQVCDDIVHGRFVSDQQQLDPKNMAVKKVEGRYPQGVFMIALGAIALFIRCGGDAGFKQIGFGFLDHILGLHIHLDGDSSLSGKYDMWEFVDKEGKPYVDEGRILLSDSGHACELVGLAFSMLNAMEGHYSLDDAERKKIDDYRQVLPRILRKNFANGFSPKGFGIAKAVDLISRKRINSDMPWWSLPETMRAAALSLKVVSPEEAEAFEMIVVQCFNAFVENYVKPELNLMAVQTLDKEGKPVDAIPATPDADPGYHTGLSIIDFLGL